MIIAHVADIHLNDRAGPTQESLDEQVERLLWVGHDAHGNGAGVMLVAGDLYDHTSTVAERNAAVCVMVEWARFMPVVIVYGNHDAPGDLGVLPRLSTAPFSVHAFSRPDIFSQADGGGPAGLHVACLPWPRKAWLASHLGTDAGTDLTSAARQAMRTVLAGFAASIPPGEATVLLTHAELGGSVLDSGQPLTGRADIELAPADFAELDADYVALGHIHQHQIIGDRLCYAGSPRQTAFGQDAKKGYCLVDVESGRPPVIEHVTAPGRQLHTIEAVWPNIPSPAGHVDMLVTDNDITPVEEPVRQGDIYRLSYTVGEGHRQQAAEQAAAAKSAWEKAGAKHVKLDPRIIPTTRVRSEDIRTATSNRDRLEAWTKARGGDDSSLESIAAKLLEIESEVMAS